MQLVDAPMFLWLEEGVLVIANSLNVFAALGQALGLQVIDIKCGIFLDVLPYVGTLGVFIEIIGGDI